jgi:hypothetical protein
MPSIVAPFAARPMAGPPTRPGPAPREPPIVESLADTLRLAVA